MIPPKCVKSKKEVDFYPEIAAYFQEYMQSDFDSFSNSKIKVYFTHSLTLPKGLQKIISDNHLCIESLTKFAKRAPELFLDIFGIATDGVNFRLVILEIKYGKAVGLTELSQLVGYSMVSSSTYGFLINVDGQTSKILKDILSTNHQITDIVTEYNGFVQHHYFNVMEWDSLSKNIRYTNYGEINSIDKLCQYITTDMQLDEVVQKIDQ